MLPGRMPPGVTRLEEVLSEAATLAVSLPHAERAAFVGRFLLAAADGHPAPKVDAAAKLEVLQRELQEAIDSFDAANMPFAAAARIMAEHLMRQTTTDRHPLLGQVGATGGREPPHRLGSSQTQSSGTPTTEWTAAAWLDSIGCTSTVAEALLRCPDGAEYADVELETVRRLSGLSEAELAERLREEGLARRVAALLHPRLRELTAMSAVSGAALHAKFAQDLAEGNGFEMRYADLSTFFGGLELKVGTPDPNFYAAMEREHTKLADSKAAFRAGNYGISTTPEREWAFVTVPNKELEQGRFEFDREAHIDDESKRRVPISVEELKARLVDINAQLPEKEPKLMFEEGLAGRLYTGPMFAKYNDLLRGFGGTLEGCKGNKYVTTTHAINSCIIKASKLTKACRVYRGVSGGVLPQSFLEPNDHNVRGGIESAFMSTTTDRSVAMHYASRPGAPSIVFEMQMGMVDRGAELRWISQYPHEEEICFAPLTGLEVQGTRVEGSVLIISARPSVNLSAQTMEQVVAKRRKLVADMSEGVEIELHSGIVDTHPGTRCALSGMAPIRGKRYEHVLHSNISICETAFLRLGVDWLEYTKSDFVGPFFSKISAATARQRAELCKMALTAVYEALDESEVVLQMIASDTGFLDATIAKWKSTLGTVRSVLDVWLKVQHLWKKLEPVCLVRGRLPDVAKRFDGIDSAFREQMANACQISNPIEVCTFQGREEVFKANLEALELCQKAFSDYLEVIRKRFPHLYFVSEIDLVDILSAGQNPPAVQPHFAKFTDATASIDWEPDENGKLTGNARGCIAVDGEKFSYPEHKICVGAVEDWLLELKEHQSAMLRIRLKEAIDAYSDTPRDKWIDMHCSQHCIQTRQVWWTSEVHSAFDRLAQGHENAMKEYLQQCLAGLKGYAAMVLREMSKELRTKVKTLITIDTHARDIVEKMARLACNTPLDFVWQSQLRYRWPEPDASEPEDLYVNICDAQFISRHEYVGNPGRLTITALTDRCYITLTQALRLMMGGAPQGPAGTGKTETTKDLGRGLAIWVIVMNCSDQMNYKTMANMFVGLAQTGAWGCFDEFNRITIEVVSVVAMQYASILQALRAGKHSFMFDDEEINLISSVAAHITMNPGYSGRTELPENLKALFRPCAMVTPDFDKVAEINLTGEGFVESKVLANKFVTVYHVCGQLLSKQHHYDWGLRAMSGVLRIAGGVKRVEPDKSEQQIIMRAMRDATLPRLVQADSGIFLGVINDLFPKVDCPAIINPELHKAIKDVIADPSESYWGTLGRPALQPHESFVRKTINLFDGLAVRHCVFVLGAAGAAKSELWRCLAAAQSLMSIGGGHTLYNALNPKAVTTNELYGYVDSASKEAHDGIIAKIMRDFASVPANHKNANVPKWMVLDGDIDPLWVESLNTVMDDNKVLTLVTNERIPLTASMKLLFEISHLRYASPATASRAGCVFLDEMEIGWRPYMQTWAEKMGDAKAQSILLELFEQYVAPTLAMIAKEKWKHVTPVKDLAVIEVICRILEAVLTKDACPNGSEKAVYEAYFQFAAVWGIGGAFGSDKGSDFRKQFDSYWRTTFSTSAARFPDEGSVFDYFIDPSTKEGEPKRCMHWRERVPVYTHDRTKAYASIFVPTLDSARMLFFGNMCTKLKKPLMFVGNAGSAKTVIVNALLKGLDDDEWLYNIISFDSFTTSASLQPVLEAPLEKKAGNLFGPPGIKKLIYFLDDFNLPSPDKYGTQSAIAILRQHRDYGGFYDLKTLCMKRLDNTLLLAAMNPTAGSFYIIDRMQRHFCCLATPFPDAEVLAHIYKNIMGGHFEIFSDAIKEVSQPMIDCAVAVHQAVADGFVPSAVKFHYQWNLHALASVFQGLIFTSPATLKQPMMLGRLYLHEAQRVYCDRMVDESDVEKFGELLVANTKKHLSELDQAELLAEPNIFSTFVEEAERDTKLYLPLEGYGHLSKLLMKQLARYNEQSAEMDLVLFNQAMEHVCRISRIIDTPCGSALLVGVGGSGKQSLTRLAAFISHAAVFQIKPTAQYGMFEFRCDVSALYDSAGREGNQIVFLLTDEQIIDERMIAYISGILTTVDIPDLYTPRDKQTIISAIEAAGLVDSSETGWSYFIDRVRKNLHIVLCMSPVGGKMRDRCRKFPALTSYSVIDWFQPWPSDALTSVAMRFLGDVEMESDAVKQAVTEHMAFVHASVGVAAGQYQTIERRSVYVTPKSYLELITLYKDELSINREKLQVLKSRLRGGLEKLNDTNQQVAEMQIALKVRAKLKRATADSDEVVAKMKMQARVQLANRLVNGLSSESERWKSELAQLDEQYRLLTGDVLVSSSFVMYVAPFSHEFRNSLVNEKWRPDVAARRVPLTDGFDPMSLLTDAVRTASWQMEGLPADPVSTQNAAIICKSPRIPLIIDPQGLAAAWINGREKPNGLITTVPGAKRWLTRVYKALKEGVPLLMDSVSPSSLMDQWGLLRNLVGRYYVRRGGTLWVYIGDRAVKLCLKKNADGLTTDEPDINVYMQTRLPNPHFMPEVQAQTTVVNFTITEKGLEESLLATVVNAERPELGEQRAQLAAQQNAFKINLQELENRVLKTLSEADGELLQNLEFVESLEEARATSLKITEKVQIAMEAEAAVAKAREIYRPIGERGALMFSVINQMHVISHTYHFSLDLFTTVFLRAISKAKEADNMDERLRNLMATITHVIFVYVTRALFERHRLMFSSQLCMRILMRRGDLSPEELDLIINTPCMDGADRPEMLQWLPESCWGTILALADTLPHVFGGLPGDMEGSWKRWKELFDNEQPENEPLPGEWKRLTAFQRLLVIRALRNDRMTLAMRNWGILEMGVEYFNAISYDLPASFEDASPATPIYFLLSPGVDPGPDVEVIGKAHNKDEANGLYVSVSLGQGQEPVAEKALDRMHVLGGWVLLQNIELVPSWLPKLETKLDAFGEGAHSDFRVFLSSLPRTTVPILILQNSIKLTNEPPTGLKANLKRAYLTFDETLWENSSKQAEFKTIVFALCFFHSVVCERRKFGPLGWNRGYPFNPGDLKDCIQVAYNYLEGSTTIPWDDLRYLFGEIFYGGHISDNYDRAVCTAYLLAYVRVELLEGIAMFPGFASPPPMSYKDYLQYIEERLKCETPMAYGLHPNAEINFMTQQATTLFSDIAKLSPKGGGGGEGGMTQSEKVKLVLDDILEQLPDLFSMLEIKERIDEVTPYTSVFLQECERMNALLFEMRHSLTELDAASLITEPLEKLGDALASNKVPPSWAKLAWVSRDPLSSWLQNLVQRHRQLSVWAGGLAQPNVTWISGLFNAQAFVNAMKQVASRKNDWPLNELVTTVDVTKKMSPEEVEARPRDGAYVHGLYIEGARWDIAAGCLEDSFIMELYPKMPVILMKAILTEKEDQRGVYLCPVYKQTERATPGKERPGSGFVFMMQLATKQPAAKWTMAGVAMLLAID